MVLTMLDHTFPPPAGLPRRYKHAKKFVRPSGGRFVVDRIKNARRQRVLLIFRTRSRPACSYREQAELKRHIHFLKTQSIRAAYVSLCQGSRIQANVRDKRLHNLTYSLSSRVNEPVRFIFSSSHKLKATS